MKRQTDHSCRYRASKIPQASQSVVSVHASSQGLHRQTKEKTRKKWSCSGLMLLCSCANTLPASSNSTWTRQHLEGDLTFRPSALCPSPWPARHVSCTMVHRSAPSIDLLPSSLEYKSTTKLRICIKSTPPPQPTPNQLAVPGIPRHATPAVTSWRLATRG
jgi:hypothetical protein